MPSLDGATGWLNTAPLTAEGLRGRVVVVNFWTYTCVNWLRTAPYLRAWAAAYPEAVVLGVHTPEFSFEADPGNVRRAVDELRISYPVAVDSDYAIWTAFANMYWPALYVVDADGRIRYAHPGEGAYAESEEVIRRLLTEAGADALPPPVTVEAAGVEVGADWARLGSPETYLGAERTDSLASPEPVAVGVPRQYTVPSRLGPGEWGLAGRWTVQPEAVQLQEPGGRVAVRFRARDVNLVLVPPPGGRPVRFDVRLDGRPPGTDAGDDVDDDGTGVLSAPRLHQLIRQHGPITDRTFEISFADAGARAFAFTFG